MDVLTWIMQNTEWVFGGIGVAALGWLGWLFVGRRGGQSQRAGHHSTSIQVGGDIKISRKSGERD
jgi:hypothetical protein